MTAAAAPAPPIEVLAPPGPASPVVVSVPHAGRHYPPGWMGMARVGRDVLERLEDRWVDLLAGPARQAGATLVVNRWARAIADCNRAESAMAPDDVAPALRARFGAPGRKERAGLGVVPTRLAPEGRLWRHPIEAVDLERRLDAVHRPYHAALAGALAAARRRHGWALLIDLHSMPPIPRGRDGHGARIVIGDRHGDSAADWISALLLDRAATLTPHVAHNRPYAGGHVLTRHAAPHRAVHAVQIEFDRRDYVTDDLPVEGDVRRLGAWLAEAIQAVCADYPRRAAPDWPLAAE